MPTCVLHSKYNQETLNTLVKCCHRYPELTITCTLCSRVCAEELAFPHTNGLGSLLAVCVRCSVHGALLIRVGRRVLCPEECGRLILGREGLWTVFLQCVSVLSVISLRGDLELPLLSGWKCYSRSEMLPCCRYRWLMHRGLGGAQLPPLGGAGRRCFSSTLLHPRAALAPYLSEANLARQKTPT